MILRKPTRRKQQRGVAMIMALLAVLLLAVIGMTFMFMTTTESSANQNYKDSQRAYFGSRAGLENVRSLLWSNAALNTQVSNLTMPAAGVNTGVIYVFNSNGTDKIDPTSKAGATIAANPTLDDELCHEQYAGLGLLGTTGVPCGNGANLAGEVMNNANYFQPVTFTTTDIPDTNSSSALPFKWVRIANKQNQMGLLPLSPLGAPQMVNVGQPGNAQVCWDGQQEWAIPPTVPPQPCANFSPASNPGQTMNPVWLLTSLAVTPAGSRRMTQMEVAFTPPLYPPGTISTKAPVNLLGSYVVQSYDECSCNCTNTGTKLAPVWSCVPRPPATQCYSKAHPIVSGGNINNNGSSGTIISNYGTDPVTSSVTNLNPWPYNTGALIDQFKSTAKNASTTAPWNYGCSGTPNFTAIPPQYAVCGTQTSQQFGTYPPHLSPTNYDLSGNWNPATVYVPGSVKLTSDANGSGILIVDGDLEINGGMNFYGLILVRGKVSFTGGGNQQVNLNGAILAGEDVSATDQTVSDNFGGSINFTYDRCALKQDAPPGPPKLLATHEVMY